MSNDILGQFGIQEEPKSDRDSAFKQAMNGIESITKKQRVNDLLNQFGIDENMRETIGERVITTIEDAKKIGSDLLEQFKIKEEIEPVWSQDDIHNNIIAAVDVANPNAEPTIYNRVTGEIAHSYGSISFGDFNSQPRNVEIRPVNNGYIVQVGCQSFVFEELADMLVMVNKYYSDPSGTEKLYNEGKLFK